MNYHDKITQLRNVITQELSPLLSGKNCILLEAPYYNNIGDLCIWQGELEFLKTVKANLLFTKSLYWTPTDDITRETIILLQGGGNFGDIYRTSHNFRLRIIEKYTENRIIMFPQSIWYDNPEIITQDSEILSQHSDLWLCARDRNAYDFMTKHFPANHVLLVPDMAFFISDSILESHRKSQKTSRTLFMRRTDSELVGTTPKTFQEADVKDWPGFEDLDVKYFLFHQAKRGIRVLSKLFLPLGKQWEKIIDFFAQASLRPRLVKKGLEFLEEYDHITTTRLHALILGVLLGKEVEYIDNKTGKLSDYVDTWLYDIDSVTKFNN